MTLEPTQDVFANVLLRPTVPDGAGLCHLSWRLVAITEASPGMTSVTWTRTPGGAAVRYKVHAIATDGGVAASHWSRWMTMPTPGPTTIVLV